jgi:hypothetical protein
MTQNNTKRPQTPSKRNRGKTEVIASIRKLTETAVRESLVKNFARKTGDHLRRASATQDHLWIHPHHLPAVFDDYLIEIEAIA